MGNKRVNKSVSFAQICNTAVLRSGLVNTKSVRGALLRLVATLIEYKQYESFTREEIVHDFVAFYNLKITSIMFGEIVPDLRKQELISKQDNNRFFVRKDILAKQNLLKGFDDFVCQRDLLVERFVSYAAESSVHLTKESAEQILSVYVEESIYSLGTEEPLQESLSPSEKYLVESFINGSKKSQSPCYEVFEQILVGRMLASFISSGGRTSNEAPSVFGKLTFYLDTGFVFNLLGLDLYSTSDEYRDLIATLQGMGARIKVFDHTYDEIYDIIESTLSWIGNADYSWEKASRVNQYFLNIHAERQDVEEYLATLESKLRGLGVLIEETNIDYNENDTFYQADIKAKIIEEYKRWGAFFAEKEKTYDLDAKSLFAVHKLRRGKTPRRFEQAGSVLLTTNRGISWVAKSISNEHFEGKAIPLAITDTFLSILLYFTYSDYSGALNERFCVPAAFHAFEPSKELIRKAETVLNGVRERGVITAADALSWKTNSVLTTYIVQETRNDPDNFNEDTPDRILALIEQDAAERIKKAEDKAALDIQSIRSETNRLVDKISIEADARISEERHGKEEALDLLKAMQGEKDELSKELLDRLKSERSELNAELAKLNARIDRIGTIVGIVTMVVVSLVFLGLTAFLIWLADVFKEAENLWLKIVSYVISAILLIVSLAAVIGTFSSRSKGFFVSRVRKRAEPKTADIKRKIDSIEEKIRKLSSSASVELSRVVAKD